MASRKKDQLTKHCRIFQWVEAQDPSFATAIRDLCLEGALSPGGRIAGVTFLYPKDKAFRDEIVGKTYSDDADEASKLIESLIIPDALLQGADFSRRPVGNRLNVKFADVEGADASKVKFADGIELTPASDFRPVARRVGDIAVWILAKGRPPLSGDDYRPPTPERRAKKGGADPRDTPLDNRQLLATKVEAEFDQCMRRDRCKEHNPYIAKVVSLLNYLKAKSPDTCVKVLPILDYDPVVCFYLLFEPYKTSGEFLIPEALLFGDDAWNGVDAYGNAVSEYEAIFSGMSAQQGMTATDPQSAQPVIPYVFRDRPAVSTQIDSVRQEFANVNPRQLPQKAQDVYATLAAQNTIRGMGPVFPDSTHQALAGAKKLWQDEFRFIVHAALQTMRSEPVYTTGTFAAIIRDIREIRPGNNYNAELLLTNVGDVRSDVAPRAKLLLLMRFVGSTDFLFMPVAPGVVGGAWGSMDPSDPQIYNRNIIALHGLRRTTGMVRLSGISPQALQELQIYAQTYGTLPPDVLSLAKP